MMGTQQRNSDHHLHLHHHHQNHQNQQGVIQSSIALLQERFKHLQRVKEMREKRELLKIFSNNTHNNIDNNNNNTTTTTTSATILTTSTTTSNTHNIIPRDSTMQYTYHHHHHHHDGDHDHGTDQKDQLQVFLPPNYYNCKPSSCHTSPPPSSQSSPSSSSTASPSSSWSSSSESNKEVALSLWPSTPPCKITAVNNINITAAADPFQRTTSSSFLRPIKEDTMVMNRGCMSRAFRFEDAHHVSDVDTTLHL